MSENTSAQRKGFTERERKFEMFEVVHSDMLDVVEVAKIAIEIAKNLRGALDVSDKVKVEFRYEEGLCSLSVYDALNRDTEVILNWRNEE